MYQTVIKLKDGLGQETISNVHNLAGKAFDNRAGKLQNVSKDPHVLVFEGGEKDYGCLNLGMLSLRASPVLSNIAAMRWVDEEPDESCDILEVFARHSG